MSVAKLTDAPACSIAVSASPTSSADEPQLPATIGRDPHADEVLGARLLGEVVGVGVDVDEPRRDDEPGGVDHVTRVELRERADLDDASVLDRDVRPPRRRAGAIDDLAAGNQQVITGLDLGRQLSKHADEQQRANDATGHRSDEDHATDIVSVTPRLPTTD